MCCVSFLLCVQDVAELKEEDLSSVTATSTELPSTPNDGTCSSDAIEPHKAVTCTPGPVSSTELPAALPSLLPTAAAGVSGDLSRTLGEYTGLLHCVLPLSLPCLIAHRHR